MRNEYIPRVLKEYRKKNQYTVNDVSLLLHQRSFDVAPKTIYGWESGQANPSADILLTLCEMYNITDVLSVFGYKDSESFYVTSSERALIESYRKHPDLQKAVNKLLDLGVVKKKKKPAK
ncbi:MAG: helix-turn-helix transcriptional regulator [Roseburia sp.]